MRAQQRLQRNRPQIRFERSSCANIYCARCHMIPQDRPEEFEKLARAPIKDIMT